MIDPSFSFAQATWLSSCELCPHRCGANRLKGERGICGADAVLRVARAALHEWEEPLISVGAGSGAVFFSYCSLHCIYCQNAKIAQGSHGTDITIERLADIFAELQDQGAANINLVTPTHFWPHIAEAQKLYRARTSDPLPFVCNTSGYERPEVISAFAKSVDVYLTDFKYDSAARSTAAAAYSHVSDYFEVATRAIDTMLALTGEPQVDTFAGQDRLIGGVVIRHLLLPGHLEDSKRVIAHLASRFGNAVLYSVMNQYTPVHTFPDHPELNDRTTPEDYERLLDFMDELGIEDYFWQQSGTDEVGFIPDFDNTGVLPSSISSPI